MIRPTYNIQRILKMIALLSMCLLIFTACTKVSENDQTTEETAGVTEETKGVPAEASVEVETGSVDNPGVPETTDEGGLLQLLSEKSLEDYSDYEEIIIDPSGTLSLIHI